MLQFRSRRGFIRSTAAVVTGLMAGSLGKSKAEAFCADSLVTSPPSSEKILNFNPQMGYRRLGKTEFWISEVSLGGHGAIGPDMVQNRMTVLAKAVELGINYVDTNIAEECDLYGEAMAKLSSARRDRFFIGFASWPEKVTEEYEANLTFDGMMRCIEDRLRSYRTDCLDLWRPVGATWGEGQTQIPTMLMVSHRALDLVVQVFEKAHQQGKVRFLGISAHNPKVFRRVLNEYPQFSVIIFPYLFLTRELGGDSLLELAKQKDVGVIGLKPFGAGTTFGIKPREIHGAVDPRAAVLIRHMLQEKRIAAVIPGVNTPEQLLENVRGSYERNHPPRPADEQVLLECKRNYLAHLTPDYRWLRTWEYV